MSLTTSELVKFTDFCKKNNLEINPNQLELVDQLNNLINHYQSRT